MTNTLLWTLATLSILACNLGPAWAARGAIQQIDPGGEVLSSGVQNLQRRLNVRDLSNYGSPDSLFCFAPRTPQGFPDSRLFVIRTQDELEALSGHRHQNGRLCGNATPPRLNFSEVTVLGQYTSGGGCKIEFSKAVLRNPERKKISFIVEIISEGACEKMTESMNWIAVPAIPPDYEVEVEVLREPFRIPQPPRPRINFGGENDPFGVRPKF